MRYAPALGAMFAGAVGAVWMTIGWSPEDQTPPLGAIGCFVLALGCLLLGSWPWRPR